MFIDGIKFLNMASCGSSTVHSETATKLHYIAQPNLTKNLRKSSIVMLLKDPL